MPEDNKEQEYFIKNGEEFVPATLEDIEGGEIELYTQEEDGTYKDVSTPDEFDEQAPENDTADNQDEAPIEKGKHSELKRMEELNMRSVEIAKKKGWGFINQLENLIKSFE